MNHSLYIFVQFLLRDMRIFIRRLKGYVINYMILYPIMYGISFGYLMPLVSFGQHNVANTTLLFSGTMLLFLQVIVFVVNLDFLRDLESERYIDYQLSLTSGRWVLLEKITFTALFCATIACAYFPVAKLFLRSVFDTSATNWVALFAMIFIAAFFFATFNILCSCMINARTLPKFWVRVYSPMIVLGGFLVPWSAMKKLAPAFGYALLINPMLYVSEGMRQVIIGGPQFLPLWVSLSALLFFITISFMCALYFFKKRVDCIL